MNLDAKLQLKNDISLTFLRGLKTTFTVRVENKSDQAWPAQGKTPVRLTYHWLTANLDMAVFNGLRSVLPRDLSPGEAIETQIQIAAPVASGQYILQLTLVKEDVAWFEKQKFQPLELPVEVYAPEQYFMAQISILHPLPNLLYSNEFISIPVQVVNTSSCFWTNLINTPMQVISRWLNTNRTVVNNSELRTNLLESLKPTASCILLAQIKAPIEPGKYFLQLSLGQEHFNGLEKATPKLQAIEIPIDIVNIATIDAAQQQQQTVLRKALAKAIEKNIALAEYQSWINRFDTLTNVNIITIKEQIKSWPHRPLISIIMPTYNTPHAFLRAAIESVQQQIYPHWELCIADDASTDPQISEILQEYAKNEPRIKLCFRDQNGHISAASNSALELATGEYVAILDHDDMLAPHHLYFVAGEIINHPETAWIYFDTDFIDTQSLRNKGTLFKVKPNLDLSLAVSFMGTHCVYRTDKMLQAGGFRIGYEGSQDHDLALRMLDLVEWQHIRHLPYILYYWRSHPGSVACNGLAIKPYAGHAGVKAIQDYLHRHTIQAKVTQNYLLPGYRIHYTLPDNPPMVSIIIPTRNRSELVQACVASILEKTTYPNYEILIVDNDSDDENTLAYLNYLQQEELAVILYYPGKFNYSAINNYAAAQANGELICLLNNDTEVISENWLTEMVGHALRPEIGMVGARLWYENNTIQHSGVFINKAPLDHIGKMKPRRAGAFYTDLTSNLAAVTGACIVMRKAVFKEVGGLNADWLPISFNDIDLCFKVRQAGLRIVYTPYAELYHYESISRGRADAKDELSWRDYMFACWPELINLPDPFYRDNKRHTGLRRKIKIYRFSPSKLFFLHFTNATGTQFRDIITQEYQDDELFTFSTRLLLECYEGKATALTQAQQYIKTAKAVFGHFKVGIHNLFGIKQAAYVTLLSDPMHLAISHYNNLLQGHWKPFLKDTSLADMFRKGIIPGNLMTRIICGDRLDTVTWNEIDNGPFACSANFVGLGLPSKIWRGEIESVLQQSDIQPLNDQNLLSAALKNIREQFYFVGVVDNIKDTVTALGYYLDWDDYSSKLNANVPKIVPEVDAETLNVIEEYNQLDIQLYQYIRRLPSSCFINERKF